MNRFENVCFRTHEMAKKYCRVLQFYEDALKNVLKIDTIIWTGPCKTKTDARRNKEQRNVPSDILCPCSVWCSHFSRERGYLHSLPRTLRYWFLKKVAAYESVWVGVSGLKENSGCPQTLLQCMSHCSLYGLQISESQK